MSNVQTIEGLRAGEYGEDTRLKIFSGLSTFPKEALLLSNLVHLDLSQNPLSSLPSTIARLSKLKVLFLSDCNFEIFPSELAQCAVLEMVAFKNNGMRSIPEHSLPPNLRWLILTNNVITEIPRSIGLCQRLQKCMLAGNRLTTLPEEMANCRKLGLLRISANDLQALPDWLLHMPELAFLAFAGNPCSETMRLPDIIPIPWTDLTMAELLGEGASGIISRGLWMRLTHATMNVSDSHVAIKLFKNAVTSDGLPADELAACVAAGKHSNLIDPLGMVIGHPEGRTGLVLQLVPRNFIILGNPPTLTTCTRDSFSQVEMSTTKGLTILQGIASAAEHLHRNNISHGDLYAHNILVDDAGQAILGDFGAATIYGQTASIAADLQRLEVLAFGHLVEDIMGLLTKSASPSTTIEALQELHSRCTTANVGERPLFRSIVQTLNGMSKLVVKSP